MERYEADASEPGSELDEASVAEVEENVAVGKRKVLSGGVRVTTSVNEQPVEETVTLRDEQVEVERQPANRKLKPEEAEAAFQEKTVEMLGTSEELEVSKEARVVGEIALGQADRRARGEGARQGPLHRGRGRGDQAELAQRTSPLGCSLRDMRLGKPRCTIARASPPSRRNPCEVS